ncbi:uncharacterized protein LOC117185843 isoform X1 [Drosophila miranda]|uniref:uncharacterized protein LOC117185843 isoform X1 n=1 Tax=Drosophila miranda TaxID=7229 RepID=UPI00143F14BA|nr:uncharacterized protein LOC117185843 isoform X1 [Drosophila miranda]
MELVFWRVCFKMDAGPVIAFFLLLTIGFLAYAVLQCFVICIAKRCFLARGNTSNDSNRIDEMAMSSTPYRQGGALNTSEDRPHDRYGDIFFIEPSSEESARIRSQLEKDDKELPSYDEVMRMCNLTTPTAAAAAPHSPLAVPSPIGIAALPAPPYSESDPYVGAAEAGAGSAISPTVITMEPEPSTSRAARTPTTTNVGRGAPLTLPNTASNTEV